MYQSSSACSNQVEPPPPPYPKVSSSAIGAGQPPSYTASIQNRQSPTQSQQDYRKSPPSSGFYSGSASAGSPSPITVSTSSPNNHNQTHSMARPTPMQPGWGARQTIQPPVIMQSVRSTQVQKPMLQTATAPTSPQPITGPSSTPPPPPSYATSIQRKEQQPQPQPLPPAYPPVVVNGTAACAPNPGASISIGVPVGVPTTEPPSYATTMQALAAQRQIHHPPPPYPPTNDDSSSLAMVSYFIFNNIA